MKVICLENKVSCIPVRNKVFWYKQTVFLFFNLYVSGKELFAVPIFVQQVFEMTLFRGLFSSEKQFTREKFTWEFYSNSWEKQCKTVRCSSILCVIFHQKSTRCSDFCSVRAVLCNRRLVHSSPCSGANRWDKSRAFQSIQWKTNSWNLEPRKTKGLFLSLSYF